MKKIFTLIIFVGACLVVAFSGSLVTTPSITNWYADLNKPAFNPPSWVFAPVWTLLFIMMGISAYLVWEKRTKKKGYGAALILFTIQLGLNYLWSFLFFGLHSPFFALIDIILLWIFILLTIIKFFKISKSAAYLLIPYLLWVTFASGLNFFVWRLN